MIIFYNNDDNNNQDNNNETFYKAPFQPFSRGPKALFTIKNLKLNSKFNKTKDKII